MLREKPVAPGRGRWPSASRRSTAGTTAVPAWTVTIPRSEPYPASLHGFERAARTQLSSAGAARYVLRPPLRAISWLSVDGARPYAVAIDRLSTPAASPREVSSWSTSNSQHGARSDVGGAVLARDSTGSHVAWLDAGFLPRCCSSLSRRD